MMFRGMKIPKTKVGWVIGAGLWICIAFPAAALPPPEDIPEEILRAELIIEARSPVDGKPLSPAEYALLRENIAESPFPPEVSPKLQQIVFLLNILNLVRTLVPIPF
jgi:hypothetical protein